MTIQEINLVISFLWICTLSYFLIHCLWCLIVEKSKITIKSEEKIEKVGNIEIKTTITATYLLVNRFTGKVIKK